MKVSPPGALFRLDNGITMCRGCGIEYEPTFDFSEKHEAKCRHVRMIIALRSLYTILLEAIPGTHTIAQSPSLSTHIDEQVTEIACAALGPCGDRYEWNGKPVYCALPLGHTHIGNVRTFNHCGFQNGYGEVVWTPGARNNEDDED